MQSSFRDPLTSSTLGAGVVALLLLGTSAWLAYDTERRAGELLPLGEAVALRISAAHLWMEEKIGGDPTIDVRSQVYGNIDSAIELLEGARQSVALARACLRTRPRRLCCTRSSSSSSNSSSSGDG